MKNKRWIYLAITSAIIVLGLASRKHGDILPEFIAEYSGDTLWVAMVLWNTLSFPVIIYTQDHCYFLIIFLLYRN